MRRPARLIESKREDQNTMKRYVTILLALLTVHLGGCGDDTPDDKLSAKVVRPYAESGVRDVEIADYQRDNGWVDPNSPNRYVVRYKFNWELKKPFYLVTLEYAQDLRKGIDDQAAGLQPIANLWTIYTTAGDWATSQGKAAYSSRYLAMTKGCPECAAWIDQETDKDERVKRVNCFVYAWSQLAQYGFADGTPAGQKVSRIAWSTFVKTENGWEHAS
jgi:hypothetical protein